jgi:membrane-associated phospholipid phosphatase
MRAELERLLPHEILFGLFLVVMALRLVPAVGPWSTDSLVFIALIALNVALIVFAERRPGTAAWKARLLFYPMAMNIVFQQLRTAIPAVHPGKADALLREIDLHLVGGNLSLALEPWVQPLATEALSLCYLLFFPYLAFSIVFYFFFAELEVLKKFFAGLFSLYGIGFLGYSLVPAGGPYLAMSGEFTVPLAGWRFTEWNQAIVAMGSNGVDVFPSLHCAVSAFLLGFDYRHRRWRFWAYLVPALGLWISTIYLRYHYFIDVVAGFALAVLALAIAGRFARKPFLKEPRYAAGS